LKILAIIGTTASGKTALALDLATQFNGVILSLDSLCIYKEINIASAKPTLQEQNLVPHFGINLLNPDEHFDVGMFFEIYKQALEFAKKNSKNLFIVGGSGFYLKSLLSGLMPKIQKIQNPPNNEQIYEIILKQDLEFAKKISHNDTYRLQKWFDIFIHIKNLGQILTVSEFMHQNTLPAIISNLTIFDIIFDKEILRNRIQDRTKNMLENGLIDEARYLFEKYPNEPKPLKSIGLKECGEFLRGEISSQNELEDLICTHTAQLAKRQRTFNKSKFENKVSGNLSEIIELVGKFLIA
jgi:tRNA dimethylallyltransferase